MFQATEVLATQNELTSAACTIICDWAESILGTRFQSVYILASYLVRNAPQNVNINSAAASILANYTEGIHSKGDYRYYLQRHCFLNFLLDIRFTIARITAIQQPHKFKSQRSPIAPPEKVTTKGI